jgi:hypothetical protein
VSCFELPNRFRNFWRDFNAVHRWRFPELSPSDLLHSLDCDLSDVDYAEFVRAQWMWTRKPRSLLGDGLSGYLTLVFVGLVMLLIPYAGFILALVWFFVMLLVQCSIEF